MEFLREDRLERLYELLQREPKMNMKDRARRFLGAIYWTDRRRAHRMRRLIGEQARRLEELATRLAWASMISNRPNLTLAEAQATKLIDRRYRHVA